MTMESSDASFDMLLFAFRGRTGLLSSDAPDMDTFVLAAAVRVQKTSYETKKSAATRDLFCSFHSSKPSTAPMFTSSVTRQRHSPRVAPDPGLPPLHPLLPSMLHRFHSYYLGCETRHRVMDRGPGWTSFG